MREKGENYQLGNHQKYVHKSTPLNILYLLLTKTIQLNNNSIVDTQNKWSIIKKLCSLLSLLRVSLIRTLQGCTCYNSQMLHNFRLCLDSHLSVIERYPQQAFYHRTCGLLRGLFLDKVAKKYMYIHSTVLYPQKCKMAMSKATV